MKIACYTNSMDGSGARRVFFEFVKRLSEKNTVDMYHLSGTPLEKFPFRDCAAQVYTYDLEQYREWRVQPWLFSVILNFLKKIFYLRKLKKVSRQISADINQRGYDMAFFDVCNLLRASYHFRFTDVPSVLYLHHPKREAFEPALFYGDIFSAQGKSVIVKIYKKLSAFLQHTDDALVGRISRTNTRHADLVLTNSYYTREYIYKAYGSLAKVVYPGIDSDIFSPAGTRKKHYLLSVGGIEENKGFKDIVRAIALIPQEQRPWLVIVAGRRQPRIYGELIRLGKEKNVHIEFFENIHDNQLIRLYSDALATVFVPLMEPLGLVPLESMACGTPVIGIREGGVRETVRDGETGLLVDRDDQELADAIMRLMEDKELYDHLSKNCREYILENWTWEKSITQLEAHCEKLIHRHSKK